MNDRFIKKICINWNEIEQDSYLREIPVLQFEEFLTFDRNVTFFAGENGSGKSTLKHPKGNYFLRAESFYNVASKAEEYRDGGAMEIYYARYGGKSLHQQSHGESILKLIQGTFMEGCIRTAEDRKRVAHRQKQAKLLPICHSFPSVLPSIPPVVIPPKTPY